MAFFLEFDKNTAVIRFLGSEDAQGSLVDSIQQTLAQRITDIRVELPANDADGSGLFEILAKLHAVLQKRGGKLKVIHQVGLPVTKLHKELKDLGCAIVAPNVPKVIEPPPKELVKEVKIHKLRQKQAGQQDRARKLLDEMKSQEKKLNEFDLDFKRLHKEAEFEAWPNIVDKFKEVREALEVELRQKEKLEREKKLYLGRIQHLKKVTDVDAASEKDLAQMRALEEQYVQSKVQIDELKNRLSTVQSQAKDSEIMIRKVQAKCEAEYGPTLVRLAQELERQKK